MNDVFIVRCEKISRRDWYYIQFPYNEQIISLIKNIEVPLRKWNKILKIWEIRADGLLELIKSYRKSNKIYFDFGGEENKGVFLSIISKLEVKKNELAKAKDILKKNKEYWVKWKQELDVTYEKYRNNVESSLKSGVKLYPHQIAGVKFLNEVKNALISHDMGIGKSLLAITYVEYNKFEKVVILTPNSLKFNFYYEVEKFTDSKAYVVNWNKNIYTAEESKYIIINYEFFNPSDKKAFDVKWNKLNIDVIDCVICDESHRLKNTKSNTYKNFKRLFKDNIFRDGKVSKIFLSGTPAPNRAYELYSILNQISPLDFKTKTHFYEYYCGMKYELGGYGWITNLSQTKFEELYHKIAPYTHRKRKDEVLNLPDKIYQKIILELSDKELKQYNIIESNVAEELKVDEYLIKTYFNPLTKIVKLRQYTADLKIKHLKNLIDNIIDTGEKIVIVDFFKNSLYKLKEIYGNIAGLHTGDQSVEERSELVRKFQDSNSNLKIFLASIQTANYGLTLTEASKMFIITLPYSVGEYDQVSDRIYRIGQKNTVNIYPVIFKNTIDEVVFDTLENKRSEIVKVIDNVEYKSDVNESVINEIIKNIKLKYK
jgi:SWI/SNF-related matrix-associated actin-dependent regulator 1 of chromatin subfamily A